MLFKSQDSTCGPFHLGVRNVHAPNNARQHAPYYTVLLWFTTAALALTLGIRARSILLSFTLPSLEFVLCLLQQDLVFDFVMFSVGTVPRYVVVILLSNSYCYCLLEICIVFPVQANNNTSTSVSRPQWKESSEYCTENTTQLYF